MLAMRNLSVIWNQLFPAEQCRLAWLLIRRVQLRDEGIDIEWWPMGWSELVGELAPHSIGAELRDLELEEMAATRAGRMPGTDNRRRGEADHVHPGAFRAKRVVMYPTTDGRLPSPANAGTSAADVTLMRALARGMHWQQLLDAGKVANIAELATAEGIDKVRVQKTLMLARPAPDLAEDIARGQYPVGLALEFFIRHPLPDDWQEQRQVMAGLCR